MVHTAAFSKTNVQSLKEKNSGDVWLPVIHMLNPSNLRPTMWRFLTFPGMSAADGLQMLALRNQDSDSLITLSTDQLPGDLSILKRE